MTQRFGTVAVVGAPNAGKSTLVNALVGQKVAIVTPKAQTTRTRLMGIAILGESQILLTDTPGVDFDLIITAQQVRSYKPGEAHFRTARARIGSARCLHAAESYFLGMTTGTNDSTNMVRGIRLYYKLQVSPAPAQATFNDVPTGHPFFQFVEALVASGITAGCGNDNYCPDNPVTRGQMAVFIAKALGLHWD